MNTPREPLTPEERALAERLDTYGPNDTTGLAQMRREEVIMVQRWEILRDE